MKSFNLLITIAIALTHLQANCQTVDYYTGRTFAEGRFINYRIANDKNSVVVSNENNRIIGSPILWLDTGEYAMAETRPGAVRDDKTIRRIVRKVFTRKEIRKYTRSKNNIEIGVAIDPHTGKTIEVDFTITDYDAFNDPVLLSIPITKLEQMEQLFKEELVWGINSRSENASYIGLSITLFWNKKRGPFLL